MLFAITFMLRIVVNQKVFITISNLNVSYTFDF